MTKRLRKKLWKGEFSPLARLNARLCQSTGLTKGEIEIGMFLLGLI
jgi:hypothetical protein